MLRLEVGGRVLTTFNSSKIIPEIHGDHDASRSASCLEEAYIKRAYTPLLSLFPPPSCTGKNWILCPNGLFTGADPSRVSSSILRFETIRGNVRSSWHEQLERRRKKERKKGNEDEGKIYLICKKFISSCLWRWRKKTKQKKRNLKSFRDDRYGNFSRELHTRLIK